jgi:hypothetical protein
MMVWSEGAAEFVDETVELRVGQHTHDVHDGDLVQGASLDDLDGEAVLGDLGEGRVRENRRRSSVSTQIVCRPGEDDREEISDPGRVEAVERDTREVERAELAERPSATTNIAGSRVSLVLTGVDLSVMCPGFRRYSVAISASVR